MLKRQASVFYRRDALPLTNQHRRSTKGLNKCDAYRVVKYKYHGIVCISVTDRTVASECERPSTSGASSCRLSMPADIQTTGHWPVCQSTSIVADCSMPVYDATPTAHSMRVCRHQPYMLNCPTCSLALLLNCFFGVQELIPYRYSSCCRSLSCWGPPLQEKPKAVSFQIRSG